MREHVRLHDMAFKKRYGQRYDEATIEWVQAEVSERLALLSSAQAQPVVRVRTARMATGSGAGSGRVVPASSPATGR
jgi:hypothetical protein